MIEYENLYNSNQPFIEEYTKAFEDVMNSGWFILGKNVDAFEQEFASYLGTEYCAGVASGLDALTLSLMVLDLPKNSEVIVPSNTYIATIMSILQVGLRPVMVEPDINTYNIDPARIVSAISKNTKAIMIVHLYGKSCDMNSILQICKENNLFLIEDCAQAHGAEYFGQKTGTFGDMAAFSFYPTKNLGCLGDGGAVVTNNFDYYEKLKKLRNYGSSKKYYNEFLGLNSRLDELQAAFLRIKLQCLDKINNHKREIASIYLKGLNKDFILPVVDDNYKDVYHIFNIRHKKRDELKQYLYENGVKTEIHYPVPPHKQKALAHFNQLHFPISEEIHSTTLSLPISSFHSKEDITTICEILKKF